MGYTANVDVEAFVDSLVERAGDRAAVHVVGESVEGRQIRATTVAPPGATPDPTRPQALVTANIHGVEVIAGEVALGVLTLLCTPGPRAHAAALLERADVTVVPMANPDSRESSVRAMRDGGRLPRGRRTNAHGVDLNRNFPFPPDARDVWYPLSGTRRRGLPWYRGEKPLSEPEAAPVDGLAGRLRPFATVNLHSTGRLFLYPYAYTARPPAHLDDFLAMGEALRAAQPMWKYRVKQSRSWYAILGCLNDYLYDEYGSLAVTLEVSATAESVRKHLGRATAPFWWANPPYPEPYVANDAPGVLAALAAAHDRTGGRPVR